MEIFRLVAKKELKDKAVLFFHTLEMLKKVPEEPHDLEYFQSKGMDEIIFLSALALKAKPITIKVQINKKEIEKAQKEIKQLNSS